MKEKKTINSKIINTHIDLLIENLEKKNIYKNIDLMLDSGLFNGGYLIGSLLYLKQLDNKSIINVKRISGTSIGSLLGLAYLLNKLEYILEYYENILYDYTEKNNLNIVTKIVKNMIFETEFNIEDVNDKLFITFHEINQESGVKKIVKNNYSSKEDLYENIIKSCFIPFLITDEYYYKEKYFDGITPYIFEESNNKRLFINLLPTISSAMESFILKNENNVITRLLNGVIDIDNLLHKKKTIYCSYLDNWSSDKYIILRLRNILVVFIISVIYYIIKIINNIPDKIKKSYISENIYVIINCMLKEFIYIL